MKQFKLTFLITALMSIVSIRVSAYTCKIDGICYNLNSNSLTATVTYSGYPHNNEYTGAYGSSLAGKDVAIPSTISYNDEEYTVTAIGDKAFYDSESTVLMASITIPSTVTSIGSQAFWKCTNLTSITIPSSVTIIGSDAFYGCSGLTTIIIPNSVTSIGRSAFESTVWYNNKPDGMVYAGKVAYKYKGTMPDNTSIVIEEGTVSISPFAFHNCSGLTNVTIPNSVISIGETAFCGCSSLTSVNIPNNVTSIDKSTFSGCSSLTSLNIPNSVITISEGAFQNCSSLTSITIPNSVTTIGKSAFSGTGIYANSPNGVFYVDKWACGYKGSMPSNTTISLQEETVGVASYAFYNYSNLTSVTISNSVTSIGDYAFQNCTGLTSMIIPNSVTSIGIQAFYGCSGLTSLTIPNSVMTIGNYAFRGCSGLTSVTMPGSVMSIGSSIFSSCSSLTSITVSVTDISAFCNNTLFESLSDSEKPFRLIDEEGNEIKELVIPDNVTGIGNWSFYRCIGLTSVSIPNSVTSIGSSAFWGCSGLTSVKVESETPLSIYYNTFYLAQANATLYVPKGSKAAYEAADYWKDFKEIVEMAPPSPIIEFADANVKAICVANWDTDDDGELSEAEAAAVTVLGGVFQNKNITSFNELQYFTGLKAISYGSFLNCSSLASIILPENVTSIEESAFRDCSNLSSLTLGKNLVDIGNYSFQGCSKLPYVSIPKSVKNIGIDAFLNCSGITAVYITDLLSWIQIDFDWDENYGGTPNPLRYAHHLYVDGTLLAGNVIIPEGTTGIHRYAFDGCTDMTAITIPSSIRGIGQDAFSGCDNLSAVYIDDLSAWCKISFGDNPLIKAKHLYVNNVEIENMVIPNDIETIGEKTFSYYNALKSVEISNSVKNIGDYAFAYCGNLESVIIPNSVSRMGECIFVGCNNLTSITIENEIPPYVIEYNTFYDVSSHVTLYVPAGSKAIYEAADYWKEFKEIVEVSEQKVQFVDKDENKIEDGTTINITDGEVDVFGDTMFSTGLYVKNNSSENVYVGVSFNVKTLPNGAFQICFPMNCMNISNTGTFKTPEGTMSANEKKNLQAEWIPEENGFGTCTVELQVNIYTYNTITKEYILESEGPTVTVNMTYSDGEIPQPSTNILSSSAPTILTGKDASLSLSLTNEDEIIMTEFYMQLPDGITIEEDEDGYPIVTINSERENKHVIEVSRNNEGLYHFLSYSSKNNAFKGNEGELFNMNLVCAVGVAAGTYTATVRNIIMSDVDRNELTQSDFTFDITVLDVAMGDANGDGRINGMDIVEMVDYIMERPSNTFVFAAADLTGDGKVNGMDLVELVSLVMSQGATQAAPPSALPRREGTLQTEKLDMGTLALKRNEDGGVMLGVEDPDEFILAQMVVEVSDGTLTDVTTDNAHVVTWTPIGENRYSVLAYSMRNRLFTTNDCLLTFLGCEGNVTVKDVMLVDADREARFFADVTYNGTTGIVPTPNPSLKRRESIYDLSGRKLETRNTELGTSPKGVYIVNGKKVVVK